ncbi:MAG: hypothetical protein L3J59_15670 [Methylococcaceae bacterium]|nr:hypothetical protein [Methylococcaceae bacterium]
MFKKVTFALITFLTFASTSFAAVDLTNFSVDSATPEAMAALILPALGVIWGIRKLIKLANRS